MESIKTKEEYEAALKKIEKLMDITILYEKQLLETIKVVEDYEEIHFPIG